MFVDASRLGCDLVDMTYYMLKAIFNHMLHDAWQTDAGELANENTYFPSDVVR